MKYINVRISDEEHKWIKEEAARQKVTIQTLVRRLIESGMSKKDSWIRSASIRSKKE